LHALQRGENTGWTRIKRVRPNLSFKGPWHKDLLIGAVAGSGAQLWVVVQELNPNALGEQTKAGAQRFCVANK
jgi:hypothetical protein